MHTHAHIKTSTINIPSLKYYFKKNSKKEIGLDFMSKTRDNWSLKITDGTCEHPLSMNNEDENGDSH